MVRTLILRSLVCWGIATMVLWAQPKLEIVGGPVVDWGTVTSKQSPLKAKVRIVNTGDEELRISKVHASCGCTATLLDKDVLKPGDTAVIDVSLNVRGRRGSVTKTVTIQSNDPDHSRILVYLKANIQDPITVVPSYFVFGNLVVGKEGKAEVKVKNTTKQDIVLSDFKTTNGIQLKVKDPLTVKAGATVTLVARLVPKKAGYFTGTVSFKTSHPDFSSMQIMAYGSVKEAEKKEGEKQSKALVPSGHSHR